MYVNVIHSQWIMVLPPNVLFIFKVFTRYLIETPLHYCYLSVNRSVSDRSSLCHPLVCVCFQSPVYCECPSWINASVSLPLTASVLSRCSVIVLMEPIYTAAILTAHSCSSRTWNVCLAPDVSALARGPFCLCKEFKAEILPCKWANQVGCITKTPYLNLPH